MTLKNKGFFLSDVYTQNQSLLSFDQLNNFVVAVLTVKII